MSKLKLLVGISICGALFSGCAVGDIFGGLFGVGTIPVAERVKDTKDCIPTDLKERISSRNHYSYGYDDSALNSQFNKYYKRYLSYFTYEQATNKCNDLAIASYNEAIKKAKKLPSNIKEEEAFEKEWNVCVKMPEWLESKLDGYIAQNGTEASNLKEKWQNWFSGNNLCSAVTKALQAIESESIDLGGKKAKCKDLAYKDAHKCLAHFKNTYIMASMSLEGCVPANLKQRLRTYSTKSSNYSYEKYYDKFFDLGNKKCDKELIDIYREAIKNAKELPTSIDEEKELANEWLFCGAMPKWLEATLDKYIKQNENIDTEYIQASKFKESWQENLKGNLRIKDLGFVYGYIGRSISFGGNDTKEHAYCTANKKALKVIENDYIDLGNGKKAKCKDLSWGDAKKCMNYFNSVHNKVYDDTKRQLDIKKEREEYEQKNKK